jgi:acetyltransferase-like isoleucine patch superfamily enzyme
MRNEKRLRRRTPESRAFTERVQLVMNLTARLNVAPFDDLDARKSLLSEIFGQPVPDSLSILPPFYCDYGLGAAFGEKVFINQGCFFLDFGGITIGDRVMIGPRVTLSTAGHPVELGERYDFLTHAPIVIEDDVWIGAAATITPGVTIGRGSVVGAGAVVAKDVPPMSVVTGTSAVERKRLKPTPDAVQTAAPTGDLLPDLTLLLMSSRWQAQSLASSIWCGNVKLAASTG